MLNKPGINDTFAILFFSLFFEKNSIARINAKVLPLPPKLINKDWNVPVIIFLGTSPLVILKRFSIFNEK